MITNWQQEMWFCVAAGSRARYKNFVLNFPNVQIVAKIWPRILSQQRMAYEANMSEFKLSLVFRKKPFPFILHCISSKTSAYQREI